ARAPRDTSLVAGLMNNKMSLFRGMIVAGGLAAAIVILRASFKYGPDSFGAIEGEEVAVLYLPDKPERFAVYRQGAGLLSGTIRN
ncbi:MAG: hypothetical protein ACREAC_22060, partial [Blastocatellia bacterium]